MRSTFRTWRWTANSGRSPLTRRKISSSSAGWATLPATSSTTAKIVRLSTVGTLAGALLTWEPGATVDVTGVRRSVNIGLLDREALAAGDWVLIHVGFAMSKIDEAEAQATREFLEQLGAPYEEELAELDASTIE